MTHTPEQFYDAIVHDLVMLGVTSGSMFGAQGIKADGKVVACFLGDAMSFKLGAGSPEHSTALTIDGADLWDPSGMNRPFKDWVSVPKSGSDEWGLLAEQALRHLRQKL